MPHAVQAPDAAALDPSSNRASGWHEGEEDGVSLREAVAILGRHWRLVAAIALVVTLATAWVVHNTPPQYRAAALLRLTDAQREMTGGLADDFMQKQLGRTSDPLLSQLEVLKGRELLGVVVDRVGLRLEPTERGVTRAFLDSVQVTVPADRPDTVQIEFGATEATLRVDGAPRVRGPYGAWLSTGGVGLAVHRPAGLERATFVVAPREDAVDRLASDLAATPRDKTDAVEVTYVAGDPQTARRVVNATVYSFQSENAREAQDQSRRRRVFLEGQLRAADSLLAAAQVELSDFQSREQVFSSQTKLAAEQQGLLELEARRDSLVAVRQMYASLMQGLGSPATHDRALRTLAASPAMAANPVVSQLYLELLEHQRALDSLTTGSLGSTRAHPDVEREAGLKAATEARLVDAFHSQLAALDAQVTGLAGLQARNAGQIRALPPTAAQEVRLVQRVESIRRAADELRDELEKARVAEAVEAGQVQIVYPAPLPARPIGSGRAAKVSLGLLLGLLIGGLAAFFREHMNTAIVRREDLERLQVINLGVVPRVGDEGKGRGRKVWLPIRVLGAPSAGAPRAPGGELVTVSSPTSPAAEAYRSLRTNLIFSHAVRELKTIVVTSSGPAEGKTLTSCNLAVAFAQQGLRVLLVDADMRKPRVHRVFGLDREAGLSETILGYRAADETIRPTAVDGLFVLPAGTPPPNPSELLGGAGMRALVAEMRGRFDLVLFDTPPVLAASDSAVLGAGVDGVVVVVRAGQTESGAAAEALDHLTGVGSRVVGAVLNDPEAKLPRYGGYYYSYGYYTHEA